MLNGIELGNKRCDRQSDKIMVKGIKLIVNVQLGQDAKDETAVHHVLLEIKRSQLTNYSFLSQLGFQFLIPNKSLIESYTNQSP